MQLVKPDPLPLPLRFRACSTLVMFAALSVIIQGAEGMEAETKAVPVLIVERYSLWTMTPPYNAKLFSDGTVKYSGNIGQTQGERTTRISGPQMREILQSLKEMHFEQVASTAVPTPTRQSFAVITVPRDGQSRLVSIDNVPKELLGPWLRFFRVLESRLGIRQMRCPYMTTLMDGTVVDGCVVEESRQDKIVEEIK